MTNEVEQEIRALVREFSGYRRPVEAMTSINFDVGLDGDDAHELFETIQKRFGTRFDAFDWHRYFHSEGDCDLLSLWLRKLLRRSDMRKRLTFQRLLEAVKNGVWVERV